MQSTSRYILSALIALFASALVFFTLQVLIYAHGWNAAGWGWFILTVPPVTITLGPLCLYIVDKKNVADDPALIGVLIFGTMILIIGSLIFLYVGHPFFDQTAETFDQPSNSLIVFFIQTIVFGLPVVMTYCFTLLRSNHWFKYQRLSRL